MEYKIFSGCFAGKIHKFLFNGIHCCWWRCRHLQDVQRAELTHYLLRDMAVICNIQKYKIWVKYHMTSLMTSHSTDDKWLIGISFRSPHGIHNGQCVNFMSFIVLNIFSLPQFRFSCATITPLVWDMVTVRMYNITQILLTMRQWTYSNSRCEIQVLPMPMNKLLFYWLRMNNK